jgi:hypothetical protein
MKIKGKGTDNSLREKKWTTQSSKEQKIWPMTNRKLQNFKWGNKEPQLFLDD